MPCATTLRDRRGIGVIAVVVYLVLGLALYSAFRFLPVALTKGRVERAVLQAIEHMPASTRPDDLRDHLAKRASVGGVALEESDIEVRVESRYGARIFHIDIRYPNRVSYLGAQRRITSHIGITREIPVDEIALEWQREYERKRRLEARAEQARQRAERAQHAEAATRAHACAGRRADAQCEREAELLWSLDPAATR
jgi:hypothetical protein